MKMLKKAKEKPKMKSYYIRNYCIKNNLFTNGDTNQYSKMFQMVDENKPLRDVAVVIWICSKTNKTIEEIQSDLEEILKGE